MNACSSMVTTPPFTRVRPVHGRAGQRSCLRFLMSTAAVVGTVAAQDLAPIYLIERLGNTGVLVHFDTLEFKRYQLQSTTNLLASINGTLPWTTIYSVPPVPFPNHYIVLDPITNAPAKCYRIVVSP